MRNLRVSESRSVRIIEGIICPFSVLRESLHAIALDITRSTIPCASNPVKTMQQITVLLFIQIIQRFMLKYDRNIGIMRKNKLVLILSKTNFQFFAGARKVQPASARFRWRHETWRQEGNFLKNFSNFVKYTQIYAMKCSGSNGKYWLCVVCQHYIPFVMYALGYWWQFALNAGKFDSRKKELLLLY